MTQIASLLAVATDLWSPFYSQGGGGGLICETKLPMQELELKMQGGGRNHGILRYIHTCVLIPHVCSWAVSSLYK